MAWDYDGDGVGAIGGAYRADGLRRSDGIGDFLVAAGFAVGGAGQFQLRAFLEFGPRQVQREVETPQSAAEIGVQLARRLGQQRVAGVWHRAGFRKRRELNRSNSRGAGRQAQP